MARRRPNSKTCTLAAWTVGLCLAAAAGEIRRTHSDRGLELIGVSLDRSREPVERMVAERDLDWPHPPGGRRRAPPLRAGAAGQGAAQNHEAPDRKSVV